MRAEEDPDVIDDVALGKLVTDARLERWQSAAASSGTTFEEFVLDTLDRAAQAIERTNSPLDHVRRGV